MKLETLIAGLVIIVVIVATILLGRREPTQCSLLQEDLETLIKENHEGAMRVGKDFNQVCK